MFAQKKVTPDSVKPNYVAAQYGMLISFYGYDDAGNLISAQNNNISKGLGQTQIIDSLAVVEKFYPFIIKGIRFRVANKVTEYNIEAVPVPYAINAAQVRNTIPFTCEVSGATVKEMLVGNDVAARNVPPNDGRPTSQVPASSG